MNKTQSAIIGSVALAILIIISLFVSDETSVWIDRIISLFM